MNSLLSLHRVALDLLTSATLASRQHSGHISRGSFPVDVVHHPVIDLTGAMIASVRGLRAGPTRRNGHFS
jgi:hypothetical protein